MVDGATIGVSILCAMIASVAASWVHLWCWGRSNRRLQRLADRLEKESDARFNERLPRRIYLVRHGESKGNVDAGTYSGIPDSEVELTDKGRLQAREAGIKLRQLIAPVDKVKFWISPHRRSRQTADRIMEAFDKATYSIREEPRIREQDFGNLQDEKLQPTIMKERSKFGRFYYRFPNGESGADVYDRVSTFMETLHRDMETGHHQSMCIISHGITCRVFLMRFMRWPLSMFDNMHNLANCEIVILERNNEGWYRVVSDLRTKQPTELLSPSNFMAWYDSGTTRHGIQTGVPLSPSLDNITSLLMNNKTKSPSHSDGKTHPNDTDNKGENNNNNNDHGNGNDHDPIPTIAASTTTPTAASATTPILSG